MRKMTAILLSALLLCGAVSCGDGEPTKTPETEGTSSDVVHRDAGETNTVDTDEPAAETPPETTDGEIPDDKENEATETNAPVTQTAYVCVFEDGTAIEIGVAADAVVASLGTPLNVAEAPSCIHEGTDRIYSYNGFTLTTSPDADGTNRVHEVALTSDAVGLEGGMYIGAPLDAVTAALGNDYTEQFGVLQYLVGNAKISVVLDEDSCISSMAITANS